MRSLWLTTLAALLTLSLNYASSSAFTVQTTISNPSHFQKIFYVNMPYVYIYNNYILYDPVLYNGYKWQKLDKYPYPGFAIYPSCMDYFYTEDNNRHNFVYGDHLGQIIWTFNDGDYSANYRWTIEDEEDEIIKTLVSSDHKRAGVYC